MIDLGRETDGYNENCLGVCFALCIIKALRLARIEHCSGTVVTPFLPSGSLKVIQFGPIGTQSAAPLRVAENVQFERNLSESR